MGPASDPLTVREIAGGWAVVGEIDASTAPTLEAALADLPEGGEPVVLDLGDVTFIDSSGLRVLIALASRASDGGRSVKIDRPSPTVARLLEITGLAEMFGLESDGTTSRRNHPA